MYVSNNGADVRTAYAWLTTRDRVEEFAKSVTETNPQLEGLNEQLDNYNENPYTEADGQVARFRQSLDNLCTDPPLLTGDALATEFIIAANTAIMQELYQELQVSSSIAIAGGSEPDDAQ